MASRISELHTSNLGMNTLWHIGEYLNPEDRRMFLLWMSSDIRRSTETQLPNWIDYQLKILGHRGPIPDCLKNPLADIRATEIGILRCVLKSYTRKILRLDILDI